MGNSQAPVTKIHPQSADDITQEHIDELKVQPSTVISEGNDAAKCLTFSILRSDEFSLKSCDPCVYTGFDSVQYQDALEYYSVTPKLYEFDKYSIKAGSNPFSTTWLNKEQKSKRRHVSIAGLGESWTVENNKENINGTVNKLCGFEAFDNVDLVLNIIDALTDIGYGLTSMCNGLNSALVAIGGISLGLDVLTCVAANSKKESEKGGTKSEESTCCKAVSKGTAYLLEYVIGTILQSVIISSGIDSDNEFAWFLGYASFVISVILGTLKGWNLKYEAQLLYFHGGEYYATESDRACIRNCCCLMALVIPIFGVLAFTQAFEDSCDVS